MRRTILKKTCIISDRKIPFVDDLEKTDDLKCPKRLG